METQGVVIYFGTAEPPLGCREAAARAGVTVRSINEYSRLKSQVKLNPVREVIISAGAFDTVESRMGFEQLIKEYDGSRPKVLTRSVILEEFTEHLQPIY